MKSKNENIPLQDNMKRKNENQIEYSDPFSKNQANKKLKLQTSNTTKAHSVETKFHDKISKIVNPDSFSGKKSEMIASKNTLEVHSPTINDKKLTFKCGICDKNFKTKSSLGAHIAYVHEGKKISFRCKICDSSFTSIENLKQHIESLHKTKLQMYQKDTNSFQDPKAKDSELKYNDKKTILKTAGLHLQSNSKAEIKTELAYQYEHRDIEKVPVYFPETHIDEKIEYFEEENI